MYQDKNILAIIPARAGSKGIPGKNVKLFNGKPLLEWTIAAAKGSNHIDRIIVSTESEEIAQISRNCGAETPFMRPADLATDQATGTDVILHALGWFKERSDEYDFFVVLQPTSPLRKSTHIDEAFGYFGDDPELSAVVSVCGVEDHPFWMKTLDENGIMQPYLKTDSIPASRQDLPMLYKNNGAIYICRWTVFLEDSSFYYRKCMGFVMNRESSVDLDTMSDWLYAEYQMKHGTKK